MKNTKENKNFKEELAAYFKGVKSEWGKITWPEKQQVVSQTIVVLGVVIFFTVFVYIVDNIFRFGLSFIK